MSKVIVHIDLNAFFVRAEEIKDPSLENTPVAIGHLGRAGVVSTCSYEARKYGVRSGMPMNSAIKLCPNLKIIHGDYHFYMALSEQFKTLIKSYTPIVEEASIDEVYADFTDQIKNVNDVEKYFRDIQSTLYRKTKLKCSIGVGPTKFLAKMASDIKKPLGLTIIRKRDIDKILFPLPIDDMFGIGKKSAPRLKEIGIQTIGDLYSGLKEKRPDLIQLIGKYHKELSNCLEGQSDDVVTTEFADPKSIGNSTTLKEDTSNIEDIKSTFRYLANNISYRAKQESKLGTTIQIMAKDTLYQAHNKSCSLPHATNNADAIYDAAIKLYTNNFSDLVVRAVGVTLQNLIDPKKQGIQMTFFDFESYEEESKTKLIIDKLNKSLKGKPLKRASEVLDKNGNN